MKFKRVTGTVAVLLLCGMSTAVYAQREGGEKQEEKKPEQRAPQPKQEPQRAAQPRPQAQPRAAQAKPQEQQRAAQPRAQEQQRAAQPKPQPAQQTHAAQPARQQEHAAPQQQQRAQQTPQRAQPTQQARAQAQPQRTQQQAKSWQQQKGWQQGGGSPGHATFAQDRSQNWSSEHRTWAQRGGYGGYYIPQARFSLSFGSEHFFRLGGLPVMYQGYPQFSYGGFSFLMVDPYPSNWAPNWYASDDVYIGFNDGYYLYDRRYPDEAVAITIQL